MSTKPTPLSRLSRAAEAMGMTRSTKAQLGEFTGADARRFNRNCGQDAKCRKRWVRIANAVMDRTGDKVQAIKVANAKAPALSRPTGRKAQMGGVKDTWKPSRDDPFADFAPTEATVNRWASWQPTDVNPDAQKEAGETLRGSYGLSAPAAQMGGVPISDLKRLADRAASVDASAAGAVLDMFGGLGNLQDWERDGLAEELMRVVQGLHAAGGYPPGMSEADYMSAKAPAGKLARIKRPKRPGEHGNPYMPGQPRYVEGDGAYASEHAWNERGQIVRDSPDAPRHEHWGKTQEQILGEVKNYPSPYLRPGLSTPSVPAAQLQGGVEDDCGCGAGDNCADPAFCDLARAHARALGEAIPPWRGVGPEPDTGETFLVPLPGDIPMSTPSAPAAQLQGDGGPDDPAPTVGEMRSLIQQNEARMPYSSMRPGDVQMSSKAQLGQGDLKLREEINGGAVSTVSMPPGVTTYKYETMVTINNDEVEQVRHNTRDEALAAHQAMIAKWKDFPTDRHVPNHLRPYGASPIFAHGLSTPAPGAQMSRRPARKPDPRRAAFGRLARAAAKMGMKPKARMAGEFPGGYTEAEVWEGIRDAMSDDVDWTRGANMQDHEWRMREARAGKGHGPGFSAPSAPAARMGWDEDAERSRERSRNPHGRSRYPANPAIGPGVQPSPAGYSDPWLANTAYGLFGAATEQEAREIYESGFSAPSAPAAQLAGEADWQKEKEVDDIMNLLSETPAQRREKDREIDAMLEEAFRVEPRFSAPAAALQPPLSKPMAPKFPEDARGQKAMAAKLFAGLQGAAVKAVARQFARNHRKAGFRLAFTVARGQLAPLRRAMSASKPQTRSQQARRKA